MAASSQASSIRDVLNRNACYYCHSTKTVLPNYAALPGIRQLSEHDIQTGLAYFRIDRLYAALDSGVPPPRPILRSWKQLLTNARCRRSCSAWSTGLPA
ncbi:heme-binding domain-containing protein [Paraburkholderia ribeironis]|uniref:heme-binding domain-containing protein n=1 Tax=Paraburkholderia ribeironis TaxID=1247936 RepID=UPI00248201DC|nr:heme-binding domain-containing protein [Paraburkholderia ribeironis]